MNTKNKTSIPSIVTLDNYFLYLNSSFRSVNIEKRKINYFFLNKKI